MAALPGDDAGGGARVAAGRADRERYVAGGGGPWPDAELVLTLRLASWHSARLLHASSVAMAVLTPAAVVLSPSALNLPVDFALSLVMPAHSALAVKCIIEDYVPRPVQGISKAIWYAACGLTSLGLLKLTVSGPGVTESVKELWREK